MISPEQLIPFIILFAAGLGGLLICSRSEAIARLDRLVLFVIWGPLLVALSSLVLADLGLYSHTRIVLVVLAWLVIGLSVHVHGKKTLRKRAAPIPLDERRPLKILLLLIPLIALLVGRPYEYLRGGWDPGEYVSIAHNIERTGHVTVDDKLFAECSAEEQRLLMHNPEQPRITLQPGMLVVDQAAGALLPDYYHLYPSWLALFAGTDDSSFIFRGQHVVAVYAWLILTLAVWSMFGPWPALLAGILLAISPSQAYVARFPTSEMLTQFCLFSAFFCFARTLRRPSLAMDLTGAIALGASFAAHTTSILPAAGILLVLGVHALAHRDSSARRVLIFACAGLGLAALRSVLVTPAVTAFVYRILVNDPVKIIPLFILLGVILLLLFFGRRLFSNRQAKEGNDLLLRWLPAIGVTAAVCFAYFVRPHVFPNRDAINMIMAGWLVSPLAIIVACMFFYRQKWTTWPTHQMHFIVAGLLTTTLLITTKLIQPLYMWAVRRYAALLVPFILILACVTLYAWMVSADRKRQITAWMGYAAMAVYLGYQTLPTLAVTEYKGLPAFLDSVSRHLDNADLVLCEHWKYSTPLRYAYGFPAYQFSRQNEDTATGENAVAMDWLARKVEAGERCFYIGMNGPFFHPKFDTKLIAYEESRSPRLIRRNSGLPRTVEYDNERAGVYALMRLPQDYTRPHGSYELEIGYPSLGLENGFHGMSRSKDTLYRWTDGNGILYVPTYGDNASTRYQLRLSSGRKNARRFLPASVYLGDKKIADLEIKPIWNTYEVIVDADDDLTATMTMRLESPTWNPADYDLSGYPTNLGIRLDWVKISAVR